MLRNLLAALLLVPLIACDGNDVDPATTGSDVSLTQPIYPTGMAVHPSSRALVVVSSNFDLRFNTGAMLVADLDKVHDRLDEAPDPTSTAAIIDDAYTSGVFFPSFGNRPLFSEDGAHLLTATRENNLLAELLVEPSGTTIALDCGVIPDPDKDAPLCGVTPYAAALPGNDPFDLVIHRDEATIIEGVAALLRAPDIVFFAVRPGRLGDDRIRLFRKNVGDDIIGTRAAILLGTPNNGTPNNVRPLVLATADRIRLNATRTGALVYWFDPEPGDDTVIRRFDLFEQTGAESARALALNKEQDALFVVTRAPDAVVRLDIERDGNDLDFTLGGVGPSCREPIAAEVVWATNGDDQEIERLLVTCFSSDAVMAINPITLQVVDQVFDYGRGPYDIVFDQQAPRPTVYVSNFLDNSVSVLDLLDEDAEVRLRPRGRIGTPTPPPEDGR